MDARDVTLVISTVGNIGLGAFGLWQAHKARTRSLRDAVFGTQLALLQEVTTAASHCVAYAIRIRSHEGQPGEQEILRVKAGPVLREFMRLSVAAQSLLPKATVRALRDLAGPLGAAIVGLQTESSAEHPLAEMRRRFDALVDAARADLGVDALSSEVRLSLTGGPFVEILTRS